MKCHESATSRIGGLTGRGFKFVGGFMDIDNLIKIAMTLAFLAVGIGQPPKVLKEIRIAQLKLLK